MGVRGKGYLVKIGVGVASGLRLLFMSSFETIGVTVKEDFVRVGYLLVLFLLEFALGQMVRSGVMDTSVVGVGGKGDDVRGM